MAALFTLSLCCLCKTSLAAHSFILDISIAPLQVHYQSEALPTTALILCRMQVTKITTEPPCSNASLPISLPRYVKVFDAPPQQTSALASFSCHPGQPLPITQ